MSTLEILLWGGAAALLLTTGAALTGREPLPGSALRALGGFTVLLVADDAFGLHEGALTRVTGVPDLAARGLFVVAALLVAARHGRGLRVHPYRPVLAVAVVVLCLSLAVDLVGPQLPEELLELLGVGYWTLFAALAAVRAIREGRAE